MYTLADKLLTNPYYEIEDNIKILNGFLQLGEENINKEEQRIKDNMPQATDYNVNQGEAQSKSFVSAIMKNIDEKTLYVIHIRQRLRQSIILQLYSFLEFYLTKQCFIHNDINNLGIRLQNMTEKGKDNGDFAKIERYYLNHVKQDITLNKEYPFIKNFKDLRNKIVHSQGRFLDTNTYDKLANFASNDTYKLIKENTSPFYRIQIEDNYIIHCIDEVSEFLKELTIKKPTQ